MDKELRCAMVYELTHLSEHKARLEQLKLDLVDKNNRGSASSPPDGSRSSLPGDPTCREAIREVSIEEQIQDLVVRIKRVEIALDALRGIKRKIIDLRYIDRACYNDNEVMDMLNVCRKWYYDNRNNAIYEMINMVGSRNLRKWHLNS